MKQPKRPWWIWVLLAIVGLLIIGAIAGDPDEQSAEQTTTSTAFNEAGGTDTNGVAEPPRTIADAREAVDDDDYTTAIAIATAIGAKTPPRSASASPTASHVAALLLSAPVAEAARGPFSSRPTTTR